MIALHRHPEVLRGDPSAAGPRADGAVPRAPAGRARVQLVGRGGASVRCDRVAPSRLAPAAAGRARARLRSRHRLGREQRRQEAARSCASLVRADRRRPARPRRAFRRLQPMNSVMQSGRSNGPVESLCSNQ